MYYETFRYVPCSRIDAEGFQGGDFIVKIGTELCDN